MTFSDTNGSFDCSSLNDFADAALVFFERLTVDLVAGRLVVGFLVAALLVEVRFVGVFLEVVRLAVVAFAGVVFRFVELVLVVAILIFTPFYLVALPLLYGLEENIQ